VWLYFYGLLFCCSERNLLLLCMLILLPSRWPAAIEIITYSLRPNLVVTEGVVVSGGQFLIEITPPKIGE
jgi:hypothetical protein